MGTLSQEFANYLLSQKPDIYLLLGKNQIEQIKERLPDELRQRHVKLFSDDLREYSTAILIGIFGYDHTFADHKKYGNDFGFTGIHQNYWKYANTIGEKLMIFLNHKGYKTKFNGEGAMPVKFILNRYGLGTYGKNSIIYFNEYGSYINNLVEVFTDAPLQPTLNHFSENFETHPMCEKCNACIRNCPTQAIYAPYRVDVNRCITHLTHCIRNISEDLWGKIGNRIWGCNACQYICPINKKVKPRKRPANVTLSHPCLDGLPPLHQGAFIKLSNELKKQEYITKYLENVLIALGNSGNVGELRNIETFSQTEKGLELKSYCQYALNKIKILNRQ